MELLVAVILLGVGSCVQWECGASGSNERVQDPLPGSTRQALAADGEWWESAVFYQLIPRSFRDSDGDGEGDLAGLLERFEHLLELGVTAVCLGPIFRSPKRDSGYDVANFREIDPTYGSMEEFVELLRRAKVAGLRVVLDLVPNHTSEQHDWFQKSLRKDAAYRDYYVLRESDDGERDGHPPNNWLSLYHGTAWAKNSRDTQYHLHQFGATEPDLNYRNAKVKQEMEDIVRFWLDRGVDGIRFERVNHLLEDAQFRDETVLDPEGPVSYENYDHVHTRDLPENYAIAFDWRALFDEYNHPEAEADARKVMITSAHTGGNLESTLNWFGIANRYGAHVAQHYGLLERLTSESRAEDFQRIIGDWLMAVPMAGGVNWVLGSHEHHRLASHFGRELAAGVAMVAFTLPGSVFMYYGDEIGMEDNGDISWKQSHDPPGCNTNETSFRQYSRDPFRTPFQWDASNEWAGFSPSPAPKKKPWLPVHSNYPERNLARERSTSGSLYQLYRGLIRLHRQSATMRRGNYQSFVLANNVFAVLRSLPGDKAYATLLNVNPTEVTGIDLGWVRRHTAEAEVVLVSPAGSHEVGEIVADVTGVTMGRYEAVIFELRSAGSWLQAVQVLMVVGLCLLKAVNWTYLI